MRRDHAQLGRVEVLVAVRHDHAVALDDDAGVDGALRRDEAPDLLAGLRFDRVTPRRRRGRRSAAAGR